MKNKKLNDDNIEQPVEKKSFFSSISKAEKLFWGTIVVFFIIFGIISIIAMM